MTLYYVYLVWRRLSHEQGTNWGRFILTFENRYVADEFYMTVASLTTQAGTPHFSLFARTNAQLWAFDSSGPEEDPWWAVMYIWRDSQYSNILAPFTNSMIHTYLSDGNHSQRNEWPIIVSPAEGPDWVDGGAFFIRNKRQRTRYWFSAPDGSIQLSQSQSTKYRVTREPASGQGRRLVSTGAKQILIRSDIVMVSPVGSSTYIDIPASGRLATSTSLKTWEFGRLFKGLGTNWENDSAGTLRQYVIRTGEDEGDEWELC